MDITLNEKEKADVFKIIRLEICKRLGVTLPYGEMDLNFTNQIFSMDLGAFVTLHLEGHLRGCIGYVIGFKPLKEALKDLAVSAAFRDPRFFPLSEKEYPRIDIEVSILSPITQVTAVEDIQVGRDGLIISYGMNSGLLLPQVASEYGWNREQFLDETCRKAGLPFGSWKNKGVKIEKFTAYVFGEKERE